MPFALELQFLHENSYGEKIILGVLVDEKNKSEFELKELWKDLPQKPGESSRSYKVDLTKLFPDSKSYYYYDGSQTIPPCHEDRTKWYVLQEALSIPSQFVDEFTFLYKNNARPTQNLARRRVLLSVPR